MAPILAAEIGTPPQIIDDQRLVDLRSALAAIEDQVEPGKSYSSAEEVEVPLDMKHLLSLIEPWQSWTFEEQVSAHGRHAFEDRTPTEVSQSNVMQLLG